jgi:alpha-1,2-mannosyltransferase
MPAYVTLSYGQVNGILLLTIVLFLILGLCARNIGAGFWLALATHVKLFPALYLAYLFWRRRWRLALAATAATVLLALLTWTVMGTTVCTDFIRSRLAGLLPALFGPEEASVRLAADVFGSTGPRNEEQLPFWLRLGLTIGTLSLTFLGQRSLKGELALMVTASLLISPIGGYHMFVLLLFPLWYLLEHGLRDLGWWPLQLSGLVFLAALNSQWFIYWLIQVRGLSFLRPLAPIGIWATLGLWAVVATQLTLDRGLRLSDLDTG